MPFALFSQRHPAAYRSSQPHSLRSAAKLGLGLLSLGLTLGQSAHAGTVNWDNTPGDWFATPSHWSNGGTPGTADDAVNNSTAAMTLGQSTTIQSFFSNGAFTLNSATFSGSLANAASLLTVNNVFSINNGTINNFTINQGTGGSVVFSGASNILDNDTINSGFDLSTNANTLVYLKDAVTENGAITLGNGSSLQLYGGGVSLTLGTKGSLAGSGTVTQNGGTTLINNGTVNANSNAGSLDIDLSNFNNNGTAEATNGAALNLNTVNINNAGLLTTTGGGILNITGTLNSLAGNTINGLGGTVNINNATLNGTLNGVGATALVFNGVSNILSDGSIMNANLNLVTNPTALVYVKGAVTENKVITLGTTSGGLQLFGGGSDLTLGSTGSLAGFGTVSQNGGTTLTNNGTVNANSAANALNLSVSTFNNNSTAEATNGAALNLNTVTTNNAGLLTTTGGGILNITGTLNSLAGNTINGLGGTVNISGAYLNGTLNGVGATSLVFSNVSNILNQDGNGAIMNANLDLATHADALLYVKGAVTENKTITLGTTTNGLQLFGGGSDLTLSTTGSLSGFGAVTQNGGTILDNYGIVNASSNASSLDIDLSTFNNNATAEATKGAALNLNTVTTNNAGLLTTTGGGILNVTGTLNSLAGNTINGLGGTININNAALNGTLNGVGATSLVFNGVSNIINDGAIMNANLDLATHADALLYVKGAVTENKAITLETTTNGLQLFGGGSDLTLSSTGSLAGFGTVSQNGGTILDNNGMVNANSAVNALNLNVSTFNNNATAEATNGATLNLNTVNTNANDGSTLAATGKGSIVSITGTYTGMGSDLITASGGGQVQANNATLNGTINTDTNTALVFGGVSNIISDGAIMNANLDLVTNPTALVYVKGAVTENKAITLGTTSGGLQLFGGGSNLTLGSTGSLAGFGTVSQNGGTTLTNNGTINANSSGNTLNVNTSNFVNTGTTEVQNGATLNVTSATTDSGNLLVKNGGTATFSQGVTQTGGLTQVDGTLNSPLTLTGGTLKGIGTVVGNVVNNGGTVAAGDSPGTLAVTGNFTQAAGGTLDAQFTNTAGSLLTVSGLATLDGTLDVNYIDPAAYTGTTPFTFLDYGTLAAGTNSAGLTQYFANETALTNDTGLITGHGGFTYELINNTAGNDLQLEVLTNGAPVPEASTTISLGLLLALGGAGLWRAKRRAAAAR